MGLFDNINTVLESDVFDQWASSPLSYMGAGLASQGNLGAGFLAGAQGYRRDREQRSVADYRQAQMEAQRQAEKQDALEFELRQAAIEELRKIDPKMAAYAMAAPGAIPALAAQKYRKPSEMPAAVRTYQFYQKLNPSQREEFHRVQRSQPFINTGTHMVQPPYQPGYQSVTASQPTESGARVYTDTETGEEFALPNPVITPGGQAYEIKPKASEMPDFRAAQTAAVEGVKSERERESELADLEATYPRLMALVDELSGLGEKATYTLAGQLANTARRQLGMDPGEGAIARREYIAKVDNEILPLLRSTFGAQFTEREGQSLKATLGDPDASPQEKDAVLRSFIKSKYEQIQTKARRAGRDPAAAVKPPSSSNTVPFSALPK